MGGQLGHGDEEIRNRPTLISFFSGMNVIAVENWSLVFLGI